ncbi:NAD(P)-dependent oxidoreductase [Anaerovibrio lipolyticus]|uniref:NAD-dependent epimerase/dehydratase family protein n=1 Tax=Anaerovibrio lipolyticus TaxID=82374 RepID=UPI0026F017EB|nr:NAD(P)-dependent oxidoreductase [Anaerovibrio lipolyticus]MBE6105101.1 NAD(P)-dependent oxidoreductase [Anaerovibrio lipolyticus]
MWVNDPIFHEDLQKICGAGYIPWHEFDGKTVFITGATGIIGHYVTSALLFRNLEYKANIKVIALVRNTEAARKQYEAQQTAGLNLSFLEGTVEQLPDVEEGIDYIIHGASPTGSKTFLEQPVDVLNTLICGTRNVLELAKEKKVKSIIFLSSMEVYGNNPTEDKVDETHESFLNTMVPRNSYPEGKRLCENMCAGYYSQYNVPVKVIRLTQSFGPGVKSTDTRVFAQFLNSAMNGTDIVLLSKGRTKRCYLYLADAATAVITILLKGENGEAYNAANEDTYISIKEMAEMVAKGIAGGTIKVVVKEDEAEAKKFMSELYMNLDTQKLRSMGWSAEVELLDMYKRMKDTFLLEMK